MARTKKIEMSEKAAAVFNSYKVLTDTEEREFRNACFELRLSGLAAAQKKQMRAARAALEAELAAFAAVAEQAKMLEGISDELLLAEVAKRKGKK